MKYIYLSLILISNIATALLSYPYLSYINIVITLVFGLLLIFHDKKEKLHTPLEQQEEESTNTQNQELTDTILKKRNEEIEKLKQENQNLKTSIEELYTLLYKFEMAIPIIEKLRMLVQQHTEESIVGVTNDIFEIASKSSNLGDKIGTFLSELFFGEQSLKKDIAKLEVATKKIESAAKAFSIDVQTLSSNIRIFNNKLRDTEKYITNIIDLSEETNLLAVNTAIEAARLGHNAGGFPVIARGIQELSNKSKEIAKNITGMIDEMGKLITDLFLKLEDRVDQTVDNLSDTSKELSKISNFLSSEINIAEQSVKETEQLPQVIKNELDSIIKKLQFQDITGQIVNHMVDIVREINNLKDSIETTHHVIIDREKIRREIEQIAGNKFTVQEEWETTGIEEEFDKQEKEESDLKGDITLF